MIVHGHTLELVITRDDEDFVRNLFVSDPALSDHHMIRCDLNFSKYVPEQWSLSYRRLRAINMDKSSSDLENSAGINSPIQNCAARLILCSSRYDRITPLLREL